MKSLTIGHLAKQAGVNLETVRYYERRGLLLRPPRSASGYRLFPAEAARRLRFIRRAQELGFSLAEIGELLSLRVSRSTTSGDIRARAEVKIADIEGKINSLESMKKTLRKLTRVCDGCAPLVECPILESLDRENGIVAASGVLLGKFVWESNPIMYAGIGLLVVTSLWNTWPRRDKSNEATCPGCPTERF